MNYYKGLHNFSLNHLNKGNNNLNNNSIKIHLLMKIMKMYCMIKKASLLKEMRIFQKLKKEMKNILMKEKRKKNSRFTMVMRLNITNIPSSKVIQLKHNIIFLCRNNYSNNNNNNNYNYNNNNNYNNSSIKWVNAILLII